MYGIIIGGGSVGKRHMRNLRLLGHTDFSCVETQTERRGAIEQEFGIITFPTLTEAIASRPPEYVICAAPTFLHEMIGIEALASGAHLFMEKPLHHTLDGAQRLLAAAQKSAGIFHVNYNMRFHPVAAELQRILQSGTIGTPLYAHVEVGQYLPDWHPHEDYRTWHISKESEGGGAIVDLSHDIDYLRFVLGEEISDVAASISTLSMEMDTDDCSDMLLSFESGMRGHVHVDMLQRSYRRGGSIVGTDGTLVWDFTTGMVRCFSIANNDWTTKTMQADTNSTFVASLTSFFDAITNGDLTGIIAPSDAARTIAVVAAAKESSRTRTFTAVARTV